MGLGEWPLNEPARARRLRKPIGEQGRDRAGRWLPQRTITSGHAERGRLLRRPGGPRVDAPRRDAAVRATAPPGAAAAVAACDCSLRRTRLAPRAPTGAARHRSSTRHRRFRRRRSRPGTTDMPMYGEPASLVKGQAFEHWNGSGALLLSDESGRPGVRLPRATRLGQRESRRPRWLRVHAPTRTQVSRPLMTSVSQLANGREVGRDRQRLMCLGRA